MRRKEDERQQDFNADPDTDCLRAGSSRAGVVPLKNHYLKSCPKLFQFQGARSNEQRRFQQHA
jgi:hypothetical protein